MLKDFLLELEKMERFEPWIPEILVAKKTDIEWLSAEDMHNSSKIGMILQQPSKTFELFLQEIPPGGTSDMQRHHHETIHYVLSGRGYSEIAGRKVRWETGDCVYTPVWAWHRHYNGSDTESVHMLGIENSRLLKTFELNRRESKGNLSWYEMTGEHPVED